MGQTGKTGHAAACREEKQTGLDNQKRLKDQKRQDNREALEERTGQDDRAGAEGKTGQDNQDERQNPAGLKKRNGLENGMTEKEYADYVKKITPVNNTFLDVCRAFFAGGIICLAGQCINRWLTGTLQLGKEDAGTWTSILLVGIAVLLTGLNLYSKIVKWGGAGALVPITGFANSVASSAIESQVEGQVFGIGCSIFKIAGPVILYGVFTSWVIGLLYWVVINWNGAFLI